MLEHLPLLGRRPADHHRPLELRQIAPDRCGRAGDEDVALLEGDVRSQCVGNRGIGPDLPAIAGARPFEERVLRAIERADRVEHRQRRLVARALRHFHLGHAGAGVALQENMRKVAPLRALPDEGNLGRALHRQLIFDEGGDLLRGGSRQLGQ